MARTGYPEAMHNYHPELFQGESLESQAQLYLTLDRCEGQEDDLLWVLWQQKKYQGIYQPTAA